MSYLQPTPGIRLGPVAVRDLAVEAKPGVQLGNPWPPGESGVVAVARGHDPVGLAHPAHLAQRCYWIAEVLQDLVGVHDVEAVRLVWDRIGVAHPEAGVGHLGPRGRGGRFLDDRIGPVQTDHGTVRHVASQVDGDGAWSTPDVQDLRGRCEPRQQVSGRVGRCPPAVGPEDSLRMTVCVDVVRCAHADRLSTRLSTVIARADTALAFEGGTEGVRRGVADAMGDGGDGRVGFEQEVSGKSEPP